MDQGYGRAAGRANQAMLHFGSHVQPFLLTWLRLFPAAAFLQRASSWWGWKLRCRGW